MKIMFDTNAFDQMTNNHFDVIKDSLKKGFEYILTTIQLEEINNIPDKENRFNKLLMLAKLSIVVVPTSCAILGYSRFDYCKLGEGHFYKKLLTPTKSNIPDSIIGDTSLYENALLVSNDRSFKNKMNRLRKDSCVGYSQFLELING